MTICMVGSAEELLASFVRPVSVAEDVEMPQKKHARSSLPAIVQNRALSVPMVEVGEREGKDKKE